MPNCNTCLPLFISKMRMERLLTFQSLDVGFIQKLKSELESKDAIIEQLMECVTLYQVELTDTDYEMQQLETNLRFFEDAVERLKAQILEKSK